MKRILLLAVLLGACAPEENDLGTVSSEGAAGSVGVASEALSASCADLHSYMRHWVDELTPGSLNCGSGLTADNYQCTTSSPPIIYYFQKRAEVTSGGTCSRIIYAYTASQSSTVWEMNCVTNGPRLATCGRRALN
jgi:hypothetical protein